jgi:hypothetical protein
MEGVTIGLKKKQIIRWRDIFTDRMINRVIDRIISSAMPSLIFNLWPDDQHSYFPPQS